MWGASLHQGRSRYSGRGRGGGEGEGEAAGGAFNQHPLVQPTRYQRHERGGGRGGACFPEVLLQLLRPSAPPPSLSGIRAVPEAACAIGPRGEAPPP